MLASVAATAEEVTVGPGSTFIEHGAVEDCLYVVVSGRVRVHHGGQVFAELGAGSSVGELAVLVPGPRSASVTGGIGVRGRVGAWAPWSICEWSICEWSICEWSTGGSASGWGCAFCLGAGISIPGICWCCAKPALEKAEAARAAPISRQFISGFAVAFAQVAHQFCKRRFHLVLHLADQLILSHVLMIERLGVAVGKGVQILGVEYALGDQLRQDHQQAVGVGDVARHQGFVDHRQLTVVVLVFDGLAHRLNVATSAGHASDASTPHRFAFSSNESV